MAAGLAVTGFTVGVGAGTHAHVVYDRGPLYKGSVKCVTINKAEISNGNNNSGYNLVRMFGENVKVDSAGNPQCLQVGQPAYHKRAGFVNVKRNGSGWTGCTGTGWVQDHETDSSHTLTSHGAVACGYGDYGTFGHGGIIENGVWQGSNINVYYTGIFSGWHTFGK